MALLHDKKESFSLSLFPFLHFPRRPVYRLRKFRLIIQVTKYILTSLIWLSSPLPSNSLFESLSTFFYLCGPRSAEPTETKQKLNLNQFRFCSSSFQFHWWSPHDWLSSQPREPDFNNVFLKIFLWKPYSKYQPIESLYHGKYNAILIYTVRPQNSSEICCKDKTREKPLQWLGGGRVVLDSVKAALAAWWA